MVKIYDEWRKGRKREAQVVVGAALSCLCPLKNIGAIIIDEGTSLHTSRILIRVTMLEKLLFSELSNRRFLVLRFSNTKFGKQS